MPGSFGCIVPSSWVRSWRSFVGVGRPMEATRDRPPGPLSTAELFELDGSVKLDLKEGLNEEHGYHVLEWPIYELYVQLYGGGPVILRYNNSGALPTLSDTPMTFVGDWKDRHPFTGEGCVFDPYSGAGFDGQLLEGFLHNGRGKGLLRSGSHYEGAVVDGLPDGRGREVNPDGTICEGVFKDGTLHGEGSIRQPGKPPLEGVWERGELCGI
jgi:hypothetical protein